MQNKQISIAPMMGYTNRHFRFFMRLLSPSIKLFTEMLVANSLFYQNRNKLLEFNKIEHPVALQLGGSDPVDLAKAAKIGEDFGYDEINLNIGCPSDRVQQAKIGACLMQEPELVAECIASMRQQVKIPVTVKTRLGVDNFDSYEFLYNFVQKIISAGANELTIHARKAWLKGVNPKQNRTLPNLKYEAVYQIKKDFPAVPIIINGGITQIQQVKQHLECVDGVMIGREAVTNSYLIAQIAQQILGENLVRHDEIIARYKEYISSELARGERAAHLFAPLMGLYCATNGARKWRIAVASKQLEQITPVL